ncbi:MAG: sterol desaturase family protein [Sandaracinaceae bacterium]|nr:sterol desaturase family protein [Sandaracinaceae bacterium]
MLLVGVLAYLYPISLAALSVLVMALERVFPWRKGQKQLRPRLGSDLLHLGFNGHFLGILLAGLADTWLLPHVDALLAGRGWTEAVYRNAAAGWPLWAQIIVALLVVDFIQWCVHNLLHRVPFLWELHKAHHSIEDGEMDWIVSFRFSWLEVIVYKSVLYLPLVFLGFAWEALMVHAIFGTLIGHLNHANLDLGHGVWRYVLNSPRMHIWHHDYDGDEKSTVNFGIIFSIWDWIFGTAKMPPEPPKRLGFAGVETFPKEFFAQEIWPLQRALPALGRHALVANVVGALVLGGAWYLHTPRSGSASSVPTPMLGETPAASQPTGVTPPAGAYAASPEEAEAALARFGEDARAAGYLHPEAMVSVAELAKALGALSLVVLDVRPPDRFAAGHVPGARRLDRGDYSSREPIPGLSRGPRELEALLRARGADDGETVVLMGDGGPEPYRLWWTLRAVGGLEVRVLDGGLEAWKAAGHRIAGGDGLDAAPGAITLHPPRDPPLRWSSVRAFLDASPHTQLVDTRSAIEWSGAEREPSAARAGRIPGARHLEWLDVLRDPVADHRLRAPAELRALFARRGVSLERPIVTYCQSGTRSAAVDFALHQLGVPPDRHLNYDGSWAEYSRLDLPAEP